MSTNRIFEPGEPGRCSGGAGHLPTNRPTSKRSPIVAIGRICVGAAGRLRFETVIEDCGEVACVKVTLVHPARHTARVDQPPVGGRRRCGQRKAPGPNCPHVFGNEDRRWNGGTKFAHRRLQARIDTVKGAVTEQHEDEQAGAPALTRAHTRRQGFGRGLIPPLVHMNDESVLSFVDIGGVPTCNVPNSWATRRAVALSGSHTRT